MNINKLSEDISVSTQIQPEDVQIISAAGYKTIVCHRPNDEKGDYAHFDTIVASANALGVKSVFQPVISGKITKSDGEKFKSIVDSHPQPIFAYCRTGTRSSILWSLAKLNDLSYSAIINITQTAGYDIDEHIRAIEETQSSALK